jgi:hypothetical protein
MARDRSRPHRIPVPDAVASLSPLGRADYTYACEVVASPGDGRSAEAWARAVFEGGPGPMRAFIVAGWIAVLRLRLGPRRSPEGVLGWRIESATPGAVVLGVESFALTNRLVVQVIEGQLVHATFVRYDRRIAGRLLWGLARPIHQVAIPYLLGHAARSAGG